MIINNVLQDASLSSMEILFAELGVRKCVGGRLGEICRKVALIERVIQFYFDVHEILQQVLYVNFASADYLAIDINAILVAVGVPELFTFRLGAGRQRVFKVARQCEMVK